ncbi:MAG: hypothetical protein UZ22_OP11002000705 [Microgenomates bacterium OLB23]|nr:MAG: hypothetical protein UZ22_OP11002000705 [Microgenomates bacterium OLB23]
MFLYSLISYTHILKHPPVWPDEAIYAEMAQHLIASNSLKTNLWGETIPHMTTQAMFYPPLLIYLVAGVQLLFGVSIEAQRMLAVIFGLVIVLVLLPLKYKSSSARIGLYSLLPSLLFITNVQALRISRFTRPEVFVIAIGLLALICVHRALNSSSRHSTRLLFLAGLAAGAACIVHQMGSIYVVSIATSLLILRSRIRPVQAFSILGGFLSATGLWLYNIVIHWDIFSTSYQTWICWENTNHSMVFN